MWREKCDLVWGAAQTRQEPRFCAIHLILSRGPAQTRLKQYGTHPEVVAAMRGLENASDRRGFSVSARCAFFVAESRSIFKRIKRCPRAK
jgi:hypothetical protein